MKKAFIIFLESQFPALLCSDDAAQWAENPRLWNPLDLAGTASCREQANKTGSCACGKFRDLTPEQKKEYKKVYYTESEF